MPQVRERDIYDALLRLKGQAVCTIGEAEVVVSLTPEDIHRSDSPDCLLWLRASLRLFGRSLTVVIPIPVEGEKRAPYAQEDLDKFIERRRYPIEMPMLVVAESGYSKREEPIRLFPTKFTVTQIPVRRLTER